MKIAKIFQKIKKSFPERRPDSQDYTKIKAALKEQVSAFGLTALTQKIPVYNFHISLLVFIIGGFAIGDLGFFYPLAGFGSGIIFYLLFLYETIRPNLARLKTTSGENLVVTIPARSKEIQKVIVVAALGSDSFIQPPPRNSIRDYLVTIWLLGLANVICLGLNWLLSFKLLLLIAMIPLLGIIYFKLFGHTANQSSRLDNCAVLTELAHILAKDRPFRTSVSLLFTASGSLNSGVLGVLELLNPKLCFSYVIDLMNLPDQRINIVTADGVLVPMPNHPLLVELLMEVARTKNIPVHELKLNRITASYPLKYKKINTVSVTNPVKDDSGTDSRKDLRELIVGLIRKLDHP